MGRLLEVSANLATLAVAVVIVVFAVEQWRGDQAAPERPPAAYVPGDRISDTPELGLRQASVSVLIGTDSTCRFCTASMSFYRRLADEAKKRGIRLIAYTLEDIEVNRNYLASHDVHPDAVISAVTSGIQLPATPQLIVARRDGTVIGTWRGQLRPSGEKEVLEAIQQ